MIIENEQHMLQFGIEFGLQLNAGDVVAINGTLGAGKTVLCRGILNALGYQDEVASPSYALLHHYDQPLVTIPIVHADLYRLNSADELGELGLFDGSSDCITLIEWAERVGSISETASHQITIEILASGTRELTVKFNRK